MVPSLGDAASFCGGTADGFGRARGLSGSTGASSTADDNDASKEGVASGGSLEYSHKTTSAAHSDSSVNGSALVGRSSRIFFQKRVLEDVEKVLKRFTSSQSRIKLQTRLI